MASIRERQPGVFEVIVSAGPDRARPGRYRQISRTVRGGKRAAQKVAAELEAEVGRGRHRTTEATMNELFDRWLAELERLGRSPATLAGYRQKLDHDIRPALGARPVSRVRAQHLNDLYTTLAARGLKARTIRQMHAIVSSALSEACRLEWIDHNPARNARVPGAGKTDTTSPEIGDVLALIEAAERRSPEMARMIFAAATIGARRGELCALRVGDVGWDRSELRVAHSVIDVTDMPLTLKGTKNDTERRVSIDPATSAVLRQQVDHVAARAAAAKVKLVKNPFVWSDELDGSRPWRPYSVTYFFRRLRNELGVEHVTFHRLRHFMITHALDAGVAVPTVAARAGHDPSVMLRVYAHSLAAADQDAAAAVAALLTPS